MQFLYFHSLSFFLYKVKTLLTIASLVEAGRLCLTTMMMSTEVHGWMDDLRFYDLFNSISVISGRCLDDNERPCAMELHLRLKKCRIERGSNSVR